jgi:hypothetical protein
MGEAAFLSVASSGLMPGAAVLIWALFPLIEVNAEKSRRGAEIARQPMRD